MKCHRLDTHCPHCGRPNDHITESVGGPDRSLPVEGDYSVCVACLNIGAFVNGPYGVAVRLLTNEEQISALGDPAVVEAVNLIRDSFREKLFRCPRCSMVSHNPVDVASGYCGHCHDWTGD